MQEEINSTPVVRTPQTVRTPALTQPPAVAPSGVAVPPDPAALTPDDLRDLAREIARACGEKPLGRDEEVEIAGDSGSVSYSRANFLEIVDRNPGHTTYEELERMLERLMTKSPAPL